MILTNEAKLIRRGLSQRGLLGQQQEDEHVGSHAHHAAQRDHRPPAVTDREAAEYAKGDPHHDLADGPAHPANDGQGLAIWSVSKK